MLGRTNTGGGGSGGLNFQVIGGTTAPNNPKENTIWINTDVEITSYIFSATQPETVTPDMVWILTGTSGHAGFNALKKNGIMVYPLSAKQYVDGAWVTKEAKINQQDEWVDWWNGTLYSYGNLDGITGGYTVVNDDSSKNVFTEESDGLYIYTHTTSNTYFVFNNKMDLKGVSKLLFYYNGFHSDFSGTTVTLGVSSNKIKSNGETINTLKSVSKNGDGYTENTLELDVSEIDEGYVYITHKTSGNYNESSMYIREVKAVIE